MFRLHITEALSSRPFSPIPSGAPGTAQVCPLAFVSALPHTLYTHSHVISLQHQRGHISTALPRLPPALSTPAALVSDSGTQCQSGDPRQLLQPHPYRRTFILFQISGNFSKIRRTSVFHLKSLISMGWSHLRVLSKPVVTQPC